MWKRVQVGLIAAAVVVGCGCLDIIRVASDSMRPTFSDGDYALVFGPQGPLRPLMGSFMNSGILRRHMVVIFRSPWAAKSSNDEKLLIKRVVGVANDRVRIDHGILFLNGRSVDEPWSYYLTLMLKEKEVWPPAGMMEPVIPDGAIFVLGDNRSESMDSRVFGCISLTSVIGIVITRVKL